MRKIKAADWKPELSAYLWNECGDGALALVDYIRQDWWIVTAPSRGNWQTSSWACTADSTLFLFDSPAEMLQHQAALQADLAARRVEWNRRAAAGRL